MELSKRFACQIEGYLISNGVDFTSFKSIPKGENESVYTYTSIN